MKLNMLEFKICDEDKLKLIDLFTQLKTLKASIKNKEDALNAKTDIKKIRNTIRSYGFIFYKPVLSFGKYTVKLDWSNEFISFAKQLLTRKHNLFDSIRQERSVNKEKKIDYSTYLFYNYEKVGGVFTKPNTIIDLKNNTSEEDKFESTKSPHKLSKNNYIGVEIECIIKCSREQLTKKIIDKGLGKYVSLKDDASIRREDGYDTAIEVTVMIEESEFNSVIEKVCKLLNTKFVGAKANNSCGLHVHLDMRNRNVRHCYSNLYRSLSILSNMVPANRRSKYDTHADRYCKKNTSPYFDTQKEKGRYYAINAVSYSKFKTLEVRMHSGTVNVNKIINWVEILKTIINSNTEPIRSFRSIKTFVSHFNMNNTLEEYITKRINKFKDLSIDTNLDEVA